MANTKISGLTAATTPLTGAEVLAGVQGAASTKVSTDSIWRKSGGLWVPPASPSVYDDEFDASTLAAKWTATGWTAGGVSLYDTSYTGAGEARYSLTDRPGWFVAQPSAHDSYKSISQPVTFASTSGVALRVQHTGRPAIGRISLIMGQNATNVAQISINWGGSPWVAATTTVESLDNNASGPGSVAWSTASLMPEFLFIGKVGTAYYFWAAGADGHWHFIFTRTMTTFAPASVAVEVWNPASPVTVVGVFAVDFVRYQASAIPPTP